MRDRSRMSLINFNKRSLFLLITCMNSSLSFGLISISLVSSSENPTMALSGVRISWLILARNADFIWSASSALIRALIRYSSTSLLCWIFKQSPFTPTLLRVESCPFFACAYLNSHHICPLPLKLYRRRVILREGNPVSSRCLCWMKSSRSSGWIDSWNCVEVIGFISISNDL